MRDRALKFLQALGGPENIVDIEGCITRIRGTVVDPGKIDIGQLMQLKIKGEPIIRGRVVQIVVGSSAEMIGAEINKIIQGK